MRALITLAISMLLVTVAYGQSVTDCYNGFGIYLEPSPAAPTSYTEFMGPGMVDLIREGVVGLTGKLSL